MSLAVLTLLGRGFARLCADIFSLNTPRLRRNVAKLQKIVAVDSDDGSRGGRREAKTCTSQPHTLTSRNYYINPLGAEIYESCRKDEGLMEAHIATNLATLKIVALCGRSRRSGLCDFAVRRRAAVFQERASFSKVASWSHVSSQPAEPPTTPPPRKSRK